MRSSASRALSNLSRQRPVSSRDTSQLFCACHHLQASSRPQRRNFQTTAATYNLSQSNQAHPLTGYYADILASPQSTHTSAAAAATTAKAVEKELTVEERAKIIFGSKLTGTGSRYNRGELGPESSWRTINGVPIPPKPAEPDNCCMSGCVHCAWDDYRDEVEAWAARVREAKAKSKAAEQGHHITSGKLPAKGRAEVQSASTSMDDDGGGSESNFGVDAVDEDDLFESIPVGIREFMKTEKKLRDLHKREQAEVS